MGEDHMTLSGCDLCYQVRGMCLERASKEKLTGELDSWEGGKIRDSIWHIFISGIKMHRLRSLLVVQQDSFT